MPKHNVDKCREYRLRTKQAEVLEINATERALERQNTVRQKNKSKARNNAISATNITNRMRRRTPSRKAARASNRQDYLQRKESAELCNIASSSSNNSKNTKNNKNTTNSKGTRSRKNTNSQPYVEEGGSGTFYPLSPKSRNSILRTVLKNTRKKKEATPELPHEPETAPQTANDIKMLNESLVVLLEMYERQKAVLTRIDRVHVELISLRNTISEFRGGNSILPKKQFTTAQEFEKFEKSIVDANFDKLVDSFELVNEKSYEKYIRSCWRKMLPDRLAEKYSWRGTVSKNSVKKYKITTALKVAFRNKFPNILDENFYRVTQKYFQYAHDRRIKLQNHAKLLKMSENKSIKE